MKIGCWREQLRHKRPGGGGVLQEAEEDCIMGSYIISTLQQAARSKMRMDLDRSNNEIVGSISPRSIDYTRVFLCCVVLRR
jgi:hypothetical protein